MKAGLKTSARATNGSSQAEKEEERSATRPPSAMNLGHAETHDVPPIARSVRGFKSMKIVAIFQMTHLGLRRSRFAVSGRQGTASPTQGSYSALSGAERVICFNTAARNGNTERRLGYATAALPSSGRAATAYASGNDSAGVIASNSFSVPRITVSSEVIPIRSPVSSLCSASIEGIG